MIWGGFGHKGYSVYRIITGVETLIREEREREKYWWGLIIYMWEIYFAVQFLALVYEINKDFGAP